MTTTLQIDAPPHLQPSAEAPIIAARGLTKRFGDFQAVRGIDFAVAPGECFGFLGPNGAGKSTTIRMICCASPLSGGDLSVAGLDVRRHGRAVKARLGVVPQETNLDDDVTVIENLVIYARYFDIRGPQARARAEELLDLFQLSERRNAKVDSLSGGMQRRLVIARALMNDPAVVVLDEPTTGLDPQARHLVWQKLRLLRARGVTMILTTHYMDEAAQLCDRLVVMNQGAIVAEGTPASLIRDHAGVAVLEFRPGIEAERVRSWLPNPAIELEASGDIVFAYARDGADLGSHLARVDQHAVLRPPTLEDVFLRLTGRVLIEE